MPPTRWPSRCRWGWASAADWPPATSATPTPCASSCRVLGRVFVAGDIDEATFRAAVFRTGLITDDDLRAAVDAQLAVKAPRWGVLDRSQLAARIDQVIARADRDAVRVRKDRLADREVLVGDVGNGLAEIVATVYAPDGHAVADRLTALAHTVCPDDPRTLAQRRSDGFGALAAGADRLACRCGRARTAPPVGTPPARWSST